MQYEGKTRGRVIFGAACIVMLALSMVLAGCGGEKETGREDLGVRTARESRPVRTVEQPSPRDIETASTPIEPEETVAEVPEPPREVTYEEAESAFHDKRYDEAVELFTLYTDRKSENPWGYYMLGLSAWKAGNHESAEEAFEKALELDPNHVKSRLNLGRALMDAGRPEEALAKIDEALEIDPESNVAFRLKGRALDLLGQREEAVGAYRRAIQMDTLDAWAMNNLGLIFLEQGRFDEALPPLARAVELRSDIAVFSNNLGMALENTGHFRAAEEAYRSAVTIDESYEKAYSNLTRVEAVDEDPGLEPVDLRKVAGSFADGIEGWSDLAIEQEQPGPVEAGSDTLAVGDAVVSAADSTGNMQEQ